MLAKRKLPYFGHSMRKTEDNLEMTSSQVIIQATDAEEDHHVLGLTTLQTGWTGRWTGYCRQCGIENTGETLFIVPPKYDE